MPQNEQSHKLSLEGRQKLSLTGVTEVVSFDDTAVVLRTCMGDLLVGGSQLQLKTLSLDGGQVAVEGHISLLQYEEPKATGGNILRRRVQEALPAQLGIEAAGAQNGTGGDGGEKQGVEQQVLGGVFLFDFKTVHLLYPSFLSICKKLHTKSIPHRPV